MFGYNSPSSDESLGGWDDLELFTSSDFEDDDSNSDTVVLPSYSHSLCKCVLVVLFVFVTKSFNDMFYYFAQLRENPFG